MFHEAARLRNSLGRLSKAYEDSEIAWEGSAESMKTQIAWEGSTEAGLVCEGLER